MAEDQIRREDKEMNFVVLDVETDNIDTGAICQIDLADYKNEVLLREWVSLVNQEEKFSHFNIGDHDFTAMSVAGAPTLPELAETLRAWLNGRSATGFSSTTPWKMPRPPGPSSWPPSARPA